MRLAVTADLHWGHSPKGDAATRELAAWMRGLEIDALVLAGDIGESLYFAQCLELFSGLSCRKLLVPGNHDLWVHAPTASSLVRYERELPRIAEAHGFEYLDLSPALFPNGEAVVGSINWYDYSFADPSVLEEYPRAEEMYRRKLFPRGDHNDGRFVRLGMPDEDFTVWVVHRLQEQLTALPADVERVVCIQHHPPLEGLFYPTPIRSTEGKFWLAYTSNRAMQDLVLSDPRIHTAICGHTHAYVECETARPDGGAPVHGINIGGDYGWKRLLLLDTDTGERQWWNFGQS